MGQSNSPDGVGVRAIALVGTGSATALEATTYSPTGYAGVFLGGRSYFQRFVGMGVINPLVQLDLAGSGDASGTANTGVIQIGGSLRIDGNEVITNTGTTLYLQNDNGGNLMVDNGTLFVNAAGNNVGIGTTAPGADKLDVRGRAYASGGWQTTNADYAEWFEKEGHAEPGDLVGINLNTGRARKYRPGDRFLGIYSTSPAYTGNRTMETDEEMEEGHLLVGLMGQLEVDFGQVVVEGRRVSTPDGIEVGILLSNNRVLLGR